MLSELVVHKATDVLNIVTEAQSSLPSTEKNRVHNAIL